MKVVFLDMDGVLVTRRCVSEPRDARARRLPSPSARDKIARPLVILHLVYILRHPRSARRGTPTPDVARRPLLTVPNLPSPRRPGVAEDELVDNLRELVDRTGARLVLSSDWRRCPRARDECGRILARRGLRLLDRTPEHGSPYTQHRATEILAWIDDHNARATTPAEGGDDARVPPTTPDRRFAFPPRSAPGDPVTHFVALDDRALIRELCGEALLGRHIMTHASEGLTRAAVDAAAAALGAPGGGLGHARTRLLDPAVWLAVTNKGVGAPTPWAAPCDEEAFPPKPRRFNPSSQPSRGSIDDGAVPMFDDGMSDADGDGCGREDDKKTPTVLTFERRRAVSRGLAPGTPSQSWERRESGASPASSDGESAGPGRRVHRRLAPRSSPHSGIVHGIVGRSVGTTPGTPPRRRPDTAASSQRGGGSRGGPGGGAGGGGGGGGGLSRTSSAASLLINCGGSWPPRVP